MCSERRRCEMSNTEMLIRLIGAAVLGSMIGLERERLLWAAGIVRICWYASGLA